MQISWVYVLWLMMAGAALSLAVVYLSIFLRRGQRAVNLTFVVMAISVVFTARAELGMMTAQTIPDFVAAQRWFHVPLAVLIVSMVAFVHLRFGTGRLWLAYAICGLRGVLLIVNFTSPVSLNYVEIESLQHVQFADNETITVGVGVTNPWTRLAALTLVMMAYYVFDAARAYWRKGDALARRRATIVGGAFLVAIVGSGTNATLVHEGIIHAPYFVTPAFMLILMGLAYELGSNAVRAGTLAIELLASEHQRREAEGRMKLAASAAALGFWEWKTREDEIWLSEDAHRLIEGGHNAVGTLASFTDRVHPDDRAGLQALVRRAVERGLDCEGEFRVLRDDGSIRWISARGRLEPSHFNGAERTLMRGVLFDVTERKRLEFELVQQRNELAHLSRVTMLGELSAALVHELNQPLTAILSNAQAAQRMIARDSRDVAQLSVILSDIVEDDRRAGDVISRLRMLLRKDEVRNQPLDLREVVKEVLRIMRSDFLNRNVVIKESYEADPALVRGDKVLLQQVFLNLFVNACDAMEHTPRPRKIIEVSIRNEGEHYLEAQVSDFGTGIPAEDLQRIFEPFISTKSRGMGLGLSVCQTIVTVHGGKLWASSKPEQGATMHLLLPVIQESTA